MLFWHRWTLQALPKPTMMVTPPEAQDYQTGSCGTWLRNTNTTFLWSWHDGPDKEYLDIYVCMHQNTSFSKGFLDRFHMLNWDHVGQMDRIYLNPWAISGSSGMFGTPSPIMLQKQKQVCYWETSFKVRFCQGMWNDKHSQSNHDAQLAKKCYIGSLWILIKDKI